MLRRILSSFAFMIILALICGLAFGGLPFYSSELTMLAFIIAMTLSFEQVDLKSINLGKETKSFGLALVVSYGLVSLASLGIGLLFPDELWYGFVVMAAVPPAAAVVAITKLLKGNVKSSFFSIFFIYIASLVLTPLIIYALAGESVDVLKIVRTVVLFIVLPLVLSRGVKRISLPPRLSNPVIKVMFFLIIFSGVGGNRHFLFVEWELVLALSAALFARTFGIGYCVKWCAQRKGMPRKDMIPLLLFSGTKNEVYAILIALTIFSGTAAIPPTIALVFEMLWIVCLEAGLVIKIK